MIQANITRTCLPEVLEIMPRIHVDERGDFFEAFRKSWLEPFGVAVDFVQHNQSFSSYGVLRGLHYQVKHPQGKLVRVLAGSIYDVAVDIRQDSVTFGRHIGVVLDGKRHNSLWVPAGFAHGFLVLSEQAQVQYQCTSYYDPLDEAIIHWQDPTLNIQWPLPVSDISVSEKDGKALFLRQQWVRP